VSQFLVVYLDSIDERLLEYLDDDEELRREVVDRLRFYANALLDGSITPAAITEDWADWFDLVGAFVAAYVPEGLTELDDGLVKFLEDPEPGGGLSEADRDRLRGLEGLLGMYPEMRQTGGR
jgi:hypothetical protein